MRIVVAPQEFKGTLTAQEAAEAMAEGARRALPDATVDVLPLADGGPGTVSAIVAATDGELRKTAVTGPMGGAVEAKWGLLPDGTAVIEMSAAAGLVLVPEEEREPRLATTFGVGELILAALDAGSRRIVIGLGGSATNDGGAGMAQALGVRLLDAEGMDLPDGGGQLGRLDRIDAAGLDPRIAECKIIGATDVRNPLCGPKGASLLYGPQKGATPETARELDSALKKYATIIQRDLKKSVADIEGAGSAGGLGAGLLAFLGAELQPGFEVVADAIGFRKRIRGASVVVTGEGRLDEQTGYGKTVSGIISMAAAANVPVLVIPGSLGPGWEGLQTYVRAIEPVIGAVLSEEHAMRNPARSLTATVQRTLTGWQG